MPATATTYEIRVGSEVKATRTSKKAAQLLANKLRGDEGLDARVFSSAGKDVSLPDGLATPVKGAPAPVKDDPAITKIADDIIAGKVSFLEGAAQVLNGAAAPPATIVTLAESIEQAKSAHPWPTTCEERVQFYRQAADAAKAWKKAGPSPMPAVLLSFNAWKGDGSPMPEGVECDDDDKPKRERKPKAAKEPKAPNAMSMRTMGDDDFERAVREAAADIVPIRAFKVVPALRKLGYSNVDEDRVLPVVKKIRAERGEEAPRGQKGAAQAKAPKATKATPAAEHPDLEAARATARLFRTEGCAAFPGNKHSAAGDTFAAEAARVTYDLLGDDMDGAASMFEDML